MKNFNQIRGRGVDDCNFSLEFFFKPFEGIKNKELIEKSRIPADFIWSVGFFIIIQIGFIDPTQNEILHKAIEEG